MRLSTSLPYTDLPEAVRHLLDDFSDINLNQDSEQVSLILEEISFRDIGEMPDDLVFVLDEVVRELRLH